MSDTEVARMCAPSLDEETRAALLASGELRAELPDAKTGRAMDPPIRRALVQRWRTRAGILPYEVKKS